MKNLTSKLIASGIMVIAAVSLAAPASADMTTAGYYDQYGNFHVYQTYTPPTSYYGGGNTYYGYNQYGYNNGYYNNGYYGGNVYGIYNNGIVNQGYSNAQSINRQPKIWSEPATTATDGLPYITSVNAYDADNDSLTFNIVTGPAGMTISPTSGQIRWDGTAGKAGKTFPVTVTVTDNRTAPVTQSYTLKVVATSGYVYKNSTGGSTSGSTSGTSGSNYTGSAFSSLLGGKSDGKLAINNVVVTSGPMNINEDKAETNCSVLVNWTTTQPTAGQVVYGTATQPDIAKFAYSDVSPEGTSYQKSHEVKLGCLANQTYYFRVIAFTANERIVSPEQTIFPIKIRTQIPTVGGNPAASSASAMGTLGKIFTSPFVLIILLGGAAYFVYARFFRKDGSGGAHGVAHGEPLHTEPALQIPHH